MPSTPVGSGHPPCPDCPICAGRMEIVYNRFNQQVCVCVECHTGLSIPTTAWEIRKKKQQDKPTDEV